MEEEKRTEKRNKSNKKTEVACVKFKDFLLSAFCCLKRWKDI